MKEYLVEITNPAICDLQSIRDYISLQLKAPDAATSLLELLETEILSLHQMPKRFPLVDEEPWHGRGIRRISVKHFLVYFLVDDNSDTVQVTGIVYARRNQKDYLGNMDS